MDVALLAASHSFDRAVTGLVEAVYSWNECVVLASEADFEAAAVLDQAERELWSLQIRCVRAAVPASGGLTLHGFMAQILERDDAAALTDRDLQAGFATLTQPGEGFDRVALLIDDAHDIRPPTMRFIQLACRSSPSLRVVLAGRPGLDAALASDEFAYLRGQITRKLALSGPGVDASTDALFQTSPREPDAARATLAAPNRSLRMSSVLGRVWFFAKWGLVASYVAWMVVRLSGPSDPPGAAARRDIPAPKSQPLAAATTIPAPAAVAAPVTSPAARGNGAQPSPRSAFDDANASTTSKTDNPGVRGSVIADPLPERSPPKSERSATATVAPPDDPGTATPIGSVASAEPVARALPLAAAKPAEADAPRKVETPEATVATRAPEPTIVESLPVPPPPQTVEPSPPPDIAQAAPRLREGAKRAAIPAVESTAERRCREIVLKAQLGGNPSDADKSFLRGGCRAK